MSNCSVRVFLFHSRRSVSLPSCSAVQTNRIRIANGICWCCGCGLNVARYRVSIAVRKLDLNILLWFEGFFFVRSFDFFLRWMLVRVCARVQKRESERISSSLLNVSVFFFIFIELFVVAVSPWSCRWFFFCLFHSHSFLPMQSFLELFFRIRRHQFIQFFFALRLRSVARVASHLRFTETN